MKRFGAAPEPGRHYIRRHGVYALLPRGSQLLVTLQSQPQHEFQLPGGGIDPGESPLAALHREVIEETGWRIGSARRLGVFRRYTFMPEYDLWAEKLCTIYVAQPIRPLGIPTEPFHESVWLDMDRAASILGNPGDRHFVSRFFTFGLNSRRTAETSSGKSSPPE